MPPWSSRTPAAWTLGALAVAVGMLLLLPSPVGPGGRADGAAASALPAAGPTPASAPAAPSVPLSEVLAAPLRPIVDASADAAPAGSVALPSAASSQPLPVVVRLGFSNGSRLGALLSGLVTPASPDYRQYLTAEQFDREFSPTPAEYATVVDYLAAAGLGPLTLYPDRLAVSFSAPPEALGAAFHTTIAPYAAGASTGWAPTAPPQLPAPVAALVAGVAGLGTAELAVPLGRVSPVAGGGTPPGPSATSGYPAPVTVDGVQYLYASDLQVGYDEESLLDLYGDPTSPNVAALVWSGEYTGGTTAATCSGSLAPDSAVGAYDPSDLTHYFAGTLPSGEDRPAVTAVPIEGAVAPGCTASWDSTGVVAANTGELEALGGVAPGASIYAVASPSPSVAALDTAFEDVLSPPSGLNASVRAGLANVSVVAVGWAAPDTKDPVWAESLAEAQARGMSVVAASGDSGGDPNSSAWTTTYANFPASASNNTTGDLAVGGTTVTLNASTLHLDSEVAWNVSKNDTKNGGPRGSSGGISADYAEPGFQKASLANAVLDGEGRGVPDVAAVANNSLVTLTVDGATSYATNATNGTSFLAEEGTAVATGYVAGMLAVIDHALTAVGDAPLGYVDPTLYPLADQEFTAPTSSSTITYAPSGSFDSGLPTLPLYDVVLGRSYKYVAGPGYDLVTGWGSLDAYNFTMYVLTVKTSGVYGDLIGVRNGLNLTGLAVTTATPGGTVDPSFNATFQQNLFVANSMGAPIYWVQSVIYVSSTGTGAWSMNFTAWVFYPFWGLYRTEAGYERYWPAVGVPEALPVDLTFTTLLRPGTAGGPPELVFTFGVPDSGLLTLDVPGAAYILGKAVNSYSWQGTTYVNGPGVNATATGFLDPQFVLVGAPTGRADTFGSSTAGNVARFEAGTSGNLTAQVEAAGSAVFQPAVSGLVYTANSQTGQSATNLTLVPVSSGLYQFDYLAGAAKQGIYAVESPQYPIDFNETAVPASATWFVNLSDGISLSATGATTTLSTSLPNGTFSFSTGVTVRNWSSLPASERFTVAGAPLVFDLAFGATSGSVTFQASGPTTGEHLAFTWTVSVSGEPEHTGTALSYTTNLTYGDYTYRIGAGNPDYAATKPTGSFVVSASPTVIKVSFVPFGFGLELIFRLPSIAPRMTVTIGNTTKTGYFTTVTVKEPNGTYPWSVTNLPGGYSASPSSGQFVVTGKVAPVVVTISKAGGFDFFGLGPLGYLLVGAGAGVAAIWVSVFRWRRRTQQKADAKKPRPGKEPEEPSPEPAPKARPPRPPRRGRRDLAPDEI